jgi:hypothetical protein
MRAIAEGEEVSMRARAHTHMLMHMHIHTHSPLAEEGEASLDGAL